ncbi:ABC1 kinase family protein [Mycolicibacterium iranicum]|uniref:AarF/ABC1/UbiB kinase family protein n=1 Tax=Mycolicibacterium iranicum TaxID=912594 RepID=A0ABT4HL34_MYCIR|nr:AarF/ABC1/UbiB kinase family protein [Mycolicibacterium iranicum]MCZ0730926.1 AarF/ABC1/UbiB kinase family protein [Mycolicibacterium iranicum]
MPDRDVHITAGRMRRTMPLAGFTARAAGGRIVAGLRERAGGQGAVAAFHERTAERYVDLLGNSKGALMKMGQLLSLIDPSDIGDGGFSPYQKAMSRLQSDAPPMPAELVRGIIAAELDKGMATFADFSDEPLAAASIGQVHRATLRDGTEVAVKVQYPGVAQAIRADLSNTELIATFLRFATSASGIVLDPRELAQEYAARIIEETDYRREAAMIDRFHRLYHDHPFIRVPATVPTACTDQVLTMTFMNGISWTEAQSAPQPLKNTWAEAITRFSYANLRHANLLHADPHPGNYRFGSDGSVGFVDFGCVKVLPERQRRLWVSIVRATIDQRFDDLRDDVISAGFLTADSPMTGEDLAAFWTQVFYEGIAAPQPVTYSAASTTRTARWMFSPDSANPLSRMHIPDAYAFAPRVQQALTLICAALHATLPARGITDDMDGVAPPCTPLGDQHHAWVRRRELPGAFDDHNAHPSAVISTTPRSMPTTGKHHDHP